MTLRAVVVGLGSIGTRHFRLLGELGCSVAVVSRRMETLEGPVFPSISDACSRFEPNVLLVCNETSRREHDLDAVVQCGFMGRVLIEKPVYPSFTTRYPVEFFQNWYVAYVLRFLPVLQELKKLLAGESVTSIEARACSYLPDWRPNRDYRTTYSASRHLGGGVLRDLSHEIDYLWWLFGPFRQLTARGGKLSRLQIDSDDTFFIVFDLESGAVVQLSLNYLDRSEERWCIVNTSTRTLKADLAKGVIEQNGKVIWASENCNSEICYRRQALAFLQTPVDPSVCTYQEGMETMRTIACIERASEEKIWITR